MNWFLANRSDLARHISYCERGGTHGHRLLAIPSRERLARLIAYLLDEREFLSPFGIRSLSRYHEAHPFSLHVQGEHKVVRYVPVKAIVGCLVATRTGEAPSGSQLLT